MIKKLTLFLFLVLVQSRVVSKVVSTEIILKDRGNNVSVKIFTPIKSTGSIVLLHGWNLPQLEWTEKTSLLKKALENGFCVIAPWFGKTTYHWEIYPETIEKYRPYPTRQWMDSVFLKKLEKEGFLPAGGNNYVAGISTGGRGAALFALEHPEYFKAAACLSADFDHAQLKDEPINNGFYGSYSKHPERWTGRDNIHRRAKEFRVPLYLAHGKKDVVCPVSQTLLFIEELQKVNPGLEIESYISESGKHDYVFWEESTDKIIAFFLRHSLKMQR